jgi:hypothetical protein
MTTERSDEDPRSGRPGRVVSVLALLGFYLLLCIAAEASLRVVFWVSDRLKADGSEEGVRDEPRARLPAYEGAEYDPVETWNELWRATDEWLSYQPYTVWSRRDHGRLVSLDSEGNRTTKYGSDEPGAPELWMFGGSTTWGMGVPDTETMPSRLAALFTDWGLDVHVRNLGKTGFVSTQELLLLIRELQRGRRPEWVVVYDGANEGIGAAEAPAQVSPHYLQNRIAALFEGRTVAGEEPLGRLWRRSGVNRLAGALRRRLGLTGAHTAPPDGRKDWRTQAPDGEAHAGVLMENYGFVEDLARAYGFEAWSFFQPRLGIGLKPLHASEAELLAGLREDPEQTWILEFTEQLQDGVRRRLARGEGPPGVVDISDLYRDVEEPVYIDWVHVTHKGNRRLAARIFERLRRDMCAHRDAVSHPGARRQLNRLCSDGETRS